jgi:two-component system, response regulator PdtaR
VAGLVFEMDQMRRPVVLVVEDEILVLTSTCEQLAAEGFTVLEASDGETALEAFQAHPEIQLVFTDINMPLPSDGLELARAIRALAPDVPLILTSGNQPPLALASDMPAGAGFVAKPYRTNGLSGLFKNMTRDRTSRRSM